MLGMFEMAVFYFEYQTMNHSGREVQGAIEVPFKPRTLSFRNSAVCTRGPIGTFTALSPFQIVEDWGR